MRTTIASYFILASLASFLIDKAEAFEFMVDSFEVVGNLPILEQDDFDDGDLSPDWIVDNGTVVEPLGSSIAIIKDPGDVSTRIEGDILLLSVQSEIETESPTYAIANGSGDATATSRWVINTTPGINELYRMGADFDVFNVSVALLRETEIHVGILNADPVFAGALGITPGLSAICMHQIDYTIGGTDSFDMQVEPIGDITGDVLLQLTFDDSENAFTAKYSLDGGATYQNPFNPFSIRVQPGDDIRFDDWDLGAQSFVPHDASCTAGNVTVGPDVTYFDGDNVAEQAEGYMDTSGAVILESGASVIYGAATSIELNPGFHAHVGSLFSATVRPITCSTGS